MTQAIRQDSSSSSPSGAQCRLRHSGARTRARARAAFTLLEVMVSIALVLILVLGINQVFGITSRTVAGGQAINGISRDARAASSTFAQDFSSAAVNTGPCIWIKSMAYVGFRNRADAEVDLDQDPSTPDTRNNSVTMADRIHRVDRIGFFVRTPTRRQTGNDSPPTFIADMSSNEAYVWYGHLMVPGAPDSNGKLLSANYRFGLEPTIKSDVLNPNGYYASQLILGRVVMLLRPKTAGTIYDTPGNAQFYINRPDDNAGVVNSTTMAPLSMDNTVNPPHSKPALDSKSTDGQWTLQDCRYDLAATTMDQYRKIIDAYRNDTANVGLSWIDALAGFRFHCNPKPVRPFTPAGFAQMSPVFVVGCTNFMVDFAGDYVTQNKTTGAVIPQTDKTKPPYGPDGDIDFYMQGTTRKIRWYGFPRDTSGNGFVDQTGKGSPISGAEGDVIPLADFVGRVASTAAGGTASSPFWFERALPDGASGVTYKSPPITTGTSQTERAQYLVAWGPDSDSVPPTVSPCPRPQLIRITMTVDDPTVAESRIAGGQTFEYVFKVQ